MSVKITTGDHSVKYAAFTDIAGATAHRAKHGGWLFLPDSGGAIWFNLTHTPTAILTHPATAGLSGRLV